MKTFKEFITEELMNEPAFALARTNMPQIFVDDFIIYLKEQNIDYSKFVIPANLLKATQKDFDRDKVDNIKSSITNNQFVSKYPIIISSDHYVLDGHHRWLATKELDKDIDVLQVDMGIVDLLKLAINLK